MLFWVDIPYAAHQHLSQSNCASMFITVNFKKKKKKKSYKWLQVCNSVYLTSKVTS